VAATHDGVRNRLSLTYPSGRTVTTTYDGLDRVQTISDGTALVGTYGYIGRRLETLTNPQVETTHEYDDAGRITRKTHTHDSVTGPVVIADYMFDWDARYDLVLRSDQLPGGETTINAYDSFHRLKRSTRSSAVDYQLDGVGNRVSVTGGPDAGSYTMDPGMPEPADFQLNQYTSTPADSRLYDANGNLVSRDGSMTSLDEFVYDYRNRMVELGGAAGPSHAYRYDALGRRIEKLELASGQSTRYYYSGPHVLEERNTTGAPKAAFIVPEVDDEVLVMAEESDLNGNSFLDTYWYHTDHIGNVLALTDASGAAVERYDYGDYGAPTVFDGAGAPLPGVQTGNPYLFTGRRFDAETGLYYFRTRYMDPHAGRFTTRDRIGTWGDAANTGNAYTYAASNPATYVDPHGEAIFVRIPPVKGDVTTNGWSPGKYFVADSFSFGVEREMKESGEKGGTEDINIGVGELQECTASKSMDVASPKLAQFAINGNSCGTAEIDFVEVAGGGDAADRPTEELAFYYNKITAAEADDQPVPTGIEHEDIGGDELTVPGCVCVIVPVPCPSCPSGWETVIGCSCG
jgi:RHS repeat-associated protein